jgi:hypothetical protein
MHNKEKKEELAMSNPEVKCTVEQCSHYVSGEQCMAAKISIHNNDTTAKSERAADTQCKSFHFNQTVGDMVGAFHNANLAGAVKAPFMDGTQITPQVECYVDNCKHWDSNNICDARSIEVSGRNAMKNPDTDCETFIAK